MTRLDREKLINEINQKWIDKKCPMCGNNNWSVDFNMVSPMTLGEDGDIQLGGRIMPLIGITCSYCGNVIFVNPLVFGAVDIDSNDK